jgi:hypothetical protein
MRLRDGLRLCHQDLHSLADHLQTHAGLEQSLALSADAHVRSRAIAEIHSRGPGNSAEHGGAYGGDRVPLHFRSKLAIIVVLPGA